MTDSNGQVPTRIVELLITNINELTKQVQQMPGQVSEEIAHDLARISEATATVISKLTTPPRNEELDKKLDNTILKVDNGNTDIKSSIDSLEETMQTKLVDKMSWMTKSVWLVFSLFAAVIFVSSLFVTFYTPKHKQVPAVEYKRDGMTVADELLLEKIEELTKTLNEHKEATELEEDNNPQ